MKLQMNADKFMGEIGWSQYEISAGAMIRVFPIYLRLSAFICGSKIIIS